MPCVLYTLRKFGDRTEDRDSVEPLNAVGAEVLHVLAVIGAFVTENY
jgi:hypothetical protein